MRINAPSLQAEPSSVDRFFWSTGSKYVNVPNTLKFWVLFSMGCFFGLGGQSAVWFVDLLPSLPKSWPFGLCVISLLLFGSAFWSRFWLKPVGTSEVRLSKPAKLLLLRIGQQVGWQNPNGRYTPRQLLRRAFKGPRTASRVLSKQSFELLEPGCHEYNRLAGLQRLAREKRRRNAPLLDQIRSASEEGIISLLNQVALIEENPESRAAVLQQAEIQVGKLKELADRFEEMLGKPEPISDQLSSSTIMDNLLDHMRQESIARNELEQEEGTRN